MTASIWTSGRRIFSEPSTTKFGINAVVLMFALSSLELTRDAKSDSYSPEQLSLQSAQELLPKLPASPEIVPAAIHRYFALSRLQAVIQEVAGALHVPYVWGGNKIGSESTCQECTECIVKKRLGPKSRTANCRACASCGIDCSHLVQQVFSAAGLEMPYAASNLMAKADPATLLRHYNLVDIGKDFENARPGDIIVYRRHVGILMANHGNNHGDLVHASRFAGGGREKVGGIRYDLNKNIVRPRGGLVRILRHRLLMAPNEPLSMVAFGDSTLLAWSGKTDETIR
jgi:hypothetical protein